MGKMKAEELTGDCARAYAAAVTDTLDWVDAWIEGQYYGIRSYVNMLRRLAGLPDRDQDTKIVNGRAIDLVRIDLEAAILDPLGDAVFANVLARHKHNPDVLDALNIRPATKGPDAGEIEPEEGGIG